MSFSFLGRSREELQALVLAKAKSLLAGASLRSGGVLRNLLEVFVELLYSLKNEDFEGLYKQIDYTAAEGEQLRQLALMYGVLPRAESKASGTLEARAKRAGSLQAGAWISPVAYPKLRYKLLEDVLYSVGVPAVLPVEAEFAGPEYNLVSGSELRFSSVNFDLELAPSAAEFPQKPGREPEGDAELRARIAARFGAAFALDLQADRIKDALYSSFSEISQVQIVRTPRGAGSVDVYVKTSGGLPSAELLSEARELFAQRRLVARDLQVLAPELKAWEVSATVDASWMLEPVRSRFEALARGLAIGQSLSVQELYNAVAGFAGVEITSPNAGLIAAENELLDLSAVNIAVRGA